MSNVLIHKAIVDVETSATHFLFRIQIVFLVEHVLHQENCGNDHLSLLGATGGVISR